jgi:hypothetical protein
MAWGPYSLKKYTNEQLKEILDEGKAQLKAAISSGNGLAARRLNSTIDDILAEQKTR